ncbi:50S ribosomal protein L19-1, chloroplastic isoform X2 [Arachis ipaensis]|uniref:50S ribosomal protein L19-1, chloroplastic isoform X2 n=1 Tax=Arachis ipaensis TaxID=130454 RepID=UPI0007AF2703|nr:50S ribosomal protein L19-1, chloroplastic isoform X2 [Arachis ipaensis]XP_025626253.1 50S ribosomal protein L19-1, chloroplastic isoform X2 [Arachis hypogaea]
MASQVVLQAMMLGSSSILQTNLNQCFPSKPLGFSAMVSSFRRNAPLISSSVSWRCAPLIAKPATFVARADSNAEGADAAASDDNVEGGGEESASASSEAEAEAEAGVEEQVEEEPKPPRKPRVKLGDIMGILNQRAIEASDKERPTPDLRTGDIVQIKLEVPENKRRLSTYKGIVISKQNAGIHTTIRIRRIIAGVGVEIVFPVYSPNIKEIKVINHRKVRRARLYYLRDKLPRLSTFK